MKNLASLFIIIVASFTQPAAAQNVVLQTETLNTCLNEDDRVDRLSCSDSLFERPADPAPLLTSPIPVANPNGFRPPRARELEALLQSSAITDEGVAVTVLSTATGERMFTDPNTFMTDITARTAKPFGAATMFIWPFLHYRMRANRVHLSSVAKTISRTCAHYGRRSTTTTLCARGFYLAKHSPMRNAGLKSVCACARGDMCYWHRAGWKAFAF